jgi:glycosyltransferase involved in cell wall biosynthesis
MVKRILIVTDNLQDQVNGVVTTFKNIEALAVLDGYRVLYLDPGQFLHFSCPGYPEVKLSIPWQIGKKIEALAPDYIHIATEGPIGLCARLCLDQRGYRYNTSYHTKFPEFIKKIYGVPESLTYAYVRWFHKHSGRVLTTTDTMVNDLRAHGFRGDIRAWTRGVDRGIFDPSLRNRWCSTTWSRTDDEKILLNVGRVSKEKGLDDFCKLKIPGTRKIVVGDGPYRARLEKKYPDVNFVGAKTGKALAEYYANADVFVFPSKTDTFGVVIIESLAVGTPVAAYDVPGPRDILEPGITGYMGPCLADAVEICLDYPRDRVVAASQRWTWDRCWQIFRQNLVDII